MFQALAFRQSDGINSVNTKLPSKNFQIWDRVVPLYQMGIVNQMWAVCTFCCNAQSNVISM